VTRAAGPLILLVALSAFVIAAASQPGLGIVHELALDIVGPIQRIVSAPARGLRSSATIDEIAAENQRLRAEIETFRIQAMRAPELAREIDRLTALLDLRRSGTDWLWLEARIIGHDPSNLMRVATIDRGENDGVTEGMTVMTSQGLVGRIHQRGRTASRVLLISDATSRVNAIVQRSRARGVVNGVRGPAGEAGLHLKDVPQGESLAAGDRLVTSGLGGIFPSGVLIGTIAEVQPRPTEMSLEATVTASAMLNQLEVVYVILNHQPLRLDG